MIKNQKGMTLLEVMIALFITVTGTLGAVALQASAKKGSFDSMQRSIATTLAQDIIERMRNNERDNLASYDGEYGAGDITALNDGQCALTTSLCNPDEMVNYDLYHWEQSLMGADAKNGKANVGGLLGGLACISSENNTVTVVVTWQGRTDIADGASNTPTVCGSTSEDLKRRQVRISAFIY